MKKICTVAVMGVLLWAAVVQAKERSAPKVPAGPVPVALLDGGRRIDFVRFLSSERDLHLKRSFFNRVIDFVAGPPEWRNLVRPYGVATDSRGRILITDPGAGTVHIFDLKKNKYSSIAGGKRNGFRSPMGITVDDRDNIYVTDSELGKVLVFNSEGKYQHAIGDLKDEGFYKRPTGIAFDKVRRELYISDTLRDRVFVTDLDGNVLRYFGGRGSDPGQFNYPTEVVVHGDEVFVVDAMNFRVQAFDREGKFRSQFGGIGLSAGNLFRPKGLAADGEDHLYLVDASLEAVQVFTRSGELLFTLGQSGSGIAGFQLPTGIWIDGEKQMYVADSYNHRVQIFRLSGPQNSVGGSDK